MKSLHLSSLSPMKKEFVIGGIVIAIQVQMKKLNNGFWGNPGLLLNQGIFIITHLNLHLLHRIPTIKNLITMTNTQIQSLVHPTLTQSTTSPPNR